MAQLIHSVLPQPRRPIVFIEPHLNVMDCVAKMMADDIGALVVHDGEKLIGMVTERDIIRSCLHADLDPHKTTAKDIAYTNISVLSVDEPVEKAMEIIIRTKRRHILIKEDGNIVAILSIGDLLFYILEDKSRVIEHLKNYIHT